MYCECQSEIAQLALTVACSVVATTIVREVIQIQTEREVDQSWTTAPEIMWLYVNPSPNDAARL